MNDADALRAMLDATEAWLDIVLMTTSLALAPWEWSGQLLLACSQATRGRT